MEFLRNGDRREHLRRKIVGVFYSGRNEGDRVDIGALVAQLMPCRCE